VKEERNSTSFVISALKAALAVWAGVTFLHGTSAQAKTPVAIELALAVDTSRSVDGFEYKIMMKGIAKAFRTPEIIALIGQLDGVAVTLFQWNSEVNEQYMIPWQLLNDSDSVMSFAAQVEQAERDPKRLFTAIGAAIDFGIRQIATNTFDGRQLKIDVSGDGRNNFGIDISRPLKKAKALGIEINGLPILTHSVTYSLRLPTQTDEDTYDLDSYYRDKVIHGPGSFVEIAKSYDDFARAFLRKLQREMTPLISLDETAPRLPVQEAHAHQGASH
jgi:hypothetical protein